MCMLQSTRISPTSSTKLSPDDAVQWTVNPHKHGQQPHACIPSCMLACIGVRAILQFT